MDIFGVVWPVCVIHFVVIEEKHQICRWGNRRNFCGGVEAENAWSCAATWCQHFTWLDEKINTRGRLACQRWRRWVNRLTRTDFGGPHDTDADGDVPHWCGVRRCLPRFSAVFTTGNWPRKDQDSCGCCLSTTKIPSFRSILAWSLVLQQGCCLRDEPLLAAPTSAAAWSGLATGRPPCGHPTTFRLTPAERRKAPKTQHTHTHTHTKSVAFLCPQRDWRLLHCSAD